MKLEAQITTPRPQSCDLCGQGEAQPVLTTPRLDGPLVRCRGCGLHYVIRPAEFQTAPVAIETPQAAATAPACVSQSEHAADEMRRLARRARELELVEPAVEEREGTWRALTAAERLRDLRRFAGSGRLLEIGCSTGEMLAAAQSSFQPVGVEADEAAAATARAHGLNCFSGTLFDAGFENGQFDAAAMYHVIEHLPSPRQTLHELHRILRPGGWLVIETPDIASFWARLPGARWRQFIPDHIFFFSPETIRRLCAEAGFEICELRATGKAMSVRLFLSRLGRYHKPLARHLAALSARLDLDDRTVHLNLGDVMRLYARKI